MKSIHRLRSKTCSTPGVWISSALVLWLGSFSFAGAYPYGITPSGASLSDVTTAYSSFKTTYFTNDCGASYERVRNNPGSANSFSEGMGYGMLMVAYLEPNATGPGLMQNLLNFVNKNLDPRNLMNWQVNCGGSVNTYSATDGDLDIAFSLIVAENRWPGNGFGTAATGFLGYIMNYETDACGLGPGDAPGFTSCSGYTYPSYFAPSYFRTFKCFTGNANWDTVNTNCYSLLNTWYTSYALPPEQINMTGGTWNSGEYQYNSCRVPWRLSLDYLWNGNTTAQSQCQKIVSNFESTDPSPSTMGDGYSHTTGARISGNHNAAFMGPAGDGAMVNASNQSWLNNEYTNLVAQSMGTAYYQDAHKVLALMVQNGIFTDVCGVGTPTFTPTPGSPTATPSFTFTNTPTPTGTAVVGCPVTFYDGETAGTNLASGTSWVNNATVSEVTTSPHSGSNCMQLAYNWPSGYYAGVGWNWAKYWTGSPRIVDLTKMNTLEFWIRATTGAPVTSMTVVLQDTSNHASAPVTVDTYLPGGVTGSWQAVDIPTSAFVPVSTFTNTAVWEIDFATGLGMMSGTQTVFVDDLVFYGPCPTNTPTPTNTLSPTSTLTFTPTRTPTFSPTPTPSPTPTFTGTPTNSFTPTNTGQPTSTYTFTGTPTDSPTPSSTPTDTYTGQPTATNTFTGSPTNSFTATFSPTPTFTGALPPTNTPTATGTSTFTVTNTFTAQPTATPTFTGSPTPTPTLPGGNTPTFTPFVGSMTPNPVDTVIVSPPYPDPIGSGSVTLDIQGAGIALVKWDVFTTAFRKIFSGTQSTPTGHIAWDLRDKSGVPVASGLYFIRVEVDGINGKRVLIKKVLVIR